MFQAWRATLKKYLWWLIGAVLIGGLALLTLRQPAQKVTAFRVQTGAIHQFIEEEGKTVLEDEYTLVLPVAGEVSRLPWRAGDWVKQGQILLQLDRFGRSLELSGLASRLQELEAQRAGVATQRPKASELAAARAQITQAGLQQQQARQQREAQELALIRREQELRRQEQLLAEGVVPVGQLEELRSQVAILKRQVRQALLEEQRGAAGAEIARQQLRRLEQSQHDPDYLNGVYQAQRQQVQAQISQKQQELAKTVLRAPISGQILELQHKDSGPLPAGTPILTLGDPASLRVELEVLSEEIYQVQPGQSVEIAGKALADRIVTGRVGRIYPRGLTRISALGVEQQRIKVLVMVDPTQLKLRPGTRVDVKIITASRSGVRVIPERALFKHNTGWHVFKIEQGIARLQAVTVGLKNNEQAEIVQGLQAGDLIVAELENTLRAGSRVEVLSEDG